MAFITKSTVYALFKYDTLSDKFKLL